MINQIREVLFKNGVQIDNSTDERVKAFVQSLIGDEVAKNMKSTCDSATQTEALFFPFNDKQYLEVLQLVTECENLLQGVIEKNQDDKVE